MERYELQKSTSQLSSAIKSQYFACEFVQIGSSEQSFKVHNYFRKIIFQNSVWRHNCYSMKENIKISKPAYLQGCGLKKCKLSDT